LVEKDVVFGLQQGSTVLKEINKEMSLESVEKLMDDTADAIAYQEVHVSSVGADEIGSIKFTGFAGNE
jgi:charged multivesicular body protein 6